MKDKSPGINFIFDGRVEQHHTKIDCAYKYITVAKQKVDKDIPVSDKSVFLFEVNEQVELMHPFSNEFVIQRLDILHHKKAKEVKDIAHIKWPC